MIFGLTNSFTCSRLLFPSSGLKLERSLADDL
jgi:hypothetical protein